MIYNNLLAKASLHDISETDEKITLEDYGFYYPLYLISLSMTIKTSIANKSDKLFKTRLKGMSDYNVPISWT